MIADRIDTELSRHLEKPFACNYNTSTLRNLASTAAKPTVDEMRPHAACQANKTQVSDNMCRDQTTSLRFQESGRR
jgi:hypothetical protein